MSHLVRCLKCQWHGVRFYDPSLANHGHCPRCGFDAPVYRAEDVRKQRLKILFKTYGRYGRKAA